MWQHVQWKGVKELTVKNELESIAIEEMKHAEMIAERLFYLGGKPTTKFEPIFVGETLSEMIKQDANDEANTIKLYKEVNDVAVKERDVTTARIFRKVLEDEEEHHDTFMSILEDIQQLKNPYSIFSIPELRLVETKS